MGKKKNTPPLEEHLVLPTHPSRLDSVESDHAATVDTHTHLLSTFEAYRATYKPGKHETIWDFVKAMYHGRRVEAIVDVWCEAPVRRAQWKELADSALDEEQRERNWSGIEYWFVMGVHPLEAMAHPRCVGWGEIGLDYHYDNSPREIQQQVFVRQLRHAIRLGKPLTIHTREAEDDTERILKEEVPKDHPVHIHCYTDSPEWAARMLAHFPNLFIGITGVITYATNLNTSAVIRQMISSKSSLSPSDALRIVLETDAPFMVPGNLYNSLPEIKGRRLPLCHTAMLPWTAEFVSRVANEAGGTWDLESVMKVARENARKMYGI
ncbi:hypothetical protein PHLCEN_2v12077 [Hermanssonia centrifuga]|uniref:Hydrolase n=1 Tax=Hermanssonia centrifuga TaxID=98765 RepID=A0A2R6NI28_9APHY|nr:hypothetical protein PHLCEN_2v12077 [Hermanssonia centrifuga]